MSEIENPLERAKAAISVAKRAISKTNDAEERIEALEQQVAELEYQLEQFHNRVDREERMFSDIRKGMANKPEERAAILIQTLNNEALTDASIGRGAKAEMDAGKARGALGGGVDRTLMYPTFECAAGLIGDEDVLEYVKEGRGGERNSRLRLNLEGDRELPDRVAGYKIRDPTTTEARSEGR